MDAQGFLEKLKILHIQQYIGVPDSLLKPLSDTLYNQYGINDDKHLIVPNEGSAVGIATGTFLATGRPSLIYMQNSGIGNIVNPVVSLIHQKVYDIPCILVIGYRGEPGEKDEPQHVFQGEITTEMLSGIGVKCFMISKNTTGQELEEYVSKAKQFIETNHMVAFVVRKDALTAKDTVAYKNNHTMTREDALKRIVQNAGKNDIFISTTGKASRELYEIREQQALSHESDFLTVGAMGHASMIAYGIAKEKKDQTVWLIDGDGAALMHLGNLAFLAEKSLPNLKHILINNGAHESVGGTPIAVQNLAFWRVARELGYDNSFCMSSLQELEDLLCKEKEQKRSLFLEIKTSMQARKDLGRPKGSPTSSKKEFMGFLKKDSV